MKALLTDDLGNTKELDHEKFYHLALNDLGVQQFFIPCDNCAKIVLKDYIVHRHLRAEGFVLLLCTVCAEKDRNSTGEEL